jgi:hypothetical protein
MSKSPRSREKYRARCSRLVLAPPSLLPSSYFASYPSMLCDHARPQVIPIAIATADTVDALKMSIESAEGIPPDFQRLIFAGCVHMLPLVFRRHLETIWNARNSRGSHPYFPPILPVYFSLVLQTRAHHGRPHSELVQYRRRLRHPPGASSQSASSRTFRRCVSTRKFPVHPRL